MRRVSIKGVLIASVAEIAASMFFVVLVAVSVNVYSQMAHVLRSAIHRHGFVTAILMIGGLLSSTFGGYLAAWIARHNELVNGGLSAFLCVLISFFQTLTGRSNYSTVFVSLIAAPACGVLGGYVRLRRNKLLKREAV